MSTIEKLFVQIFERKNSIIEQVKHQTDLYDQHLASKCIIDGISPPSWLWNPGYHTQRLDLRDLKKEQLISEILLPRPQPTNPYSSSHCSLYDKTLFPVNNVGVSEGLNTETHAPNKAILARDEPESVLQIRLNDARCVLKGVPEQDISATSPKDSHNKADASDGLFTETHTSNIGFDAGDGLTSVPQIHINGVGCVLEGVPEQDFTSTSPKDPENLRAFDMPSEPDLSLARIQRSKSRQKALEQRKSNSGAYSSGSARSRMASLQSNYANESELAKPPAIINDSFVEEEKICDSRNEEEDCNTYSGRITSSRPSCQQPSRVSNSPKLDGSSYIAKKDGDTFAESIGKSMPQPHRVSQLLESVIPSDTPDEFLRVTGAGMGDCQSKEEGSNVHCSKIIKSRNSFQQFNCVDESSKFDSSAAVHIVDGGVLELSTGKAMEQSQMSARRSSSSQEDIECAADTREDQNRGNVANESVRIQKRSQSPNIEGISEPVSSSISGHRVTLPRSAASEKSRSAQDTQTSARGSSLSRNDIKLCAEDTRENQSGGNVANEPVCRQTRSQSTNMEGISEFVSSNISGQRVRLSRFAASERSQSAQGAQRSASSPPGKDDPELGRANTVEHSSERTIVDENVCRSARSQTSHGNKGMPEPVKSSNVSDCRVTRSKSSGSNKSPHAESLNRFGGFSLQKASSTQASVLPRVDTNKIVDLKISGVIIPETQVVSDGPDEGSLCLDSKLDNASLRVGLEVLVSRPPSGSNVFVKPKQLDFDDDSLNENFITPVEENRGYRSLDKGPFKLVEPLGSLNKVTPINHQENCDSSLQKLTPEEQEVLSKVEEAQRLSSEACAKERVEGEKENIGCDFCIQSSATRASNLEPISSVKETSEVFKDAVTRTSLNGNKISEPTPLVYGLSNTVAGKGLFGSSTKRVVESNLSNIGSDSRNLFSLEKVINSAMDGSWPQYKRRKIEDQLTNFLSVPPALRARSVRSIQRDAIDRYLSSGEDNSDASLKCQFSTYQEEDVARPKVNMSPYLEIQQEINVGGFECSRELHVEEGDHSLERTAKSASTPFAFKHEKLGRSFFSSLTKLETGCSQGWMGEEMGVTNPTSMEVLDIQTECGVKDDQELLHLEDNSDQENAEKLITTDSSHKQYLDMIGVDQTMPVLEGFIVPTDDGQPGTASGGITDLSNSTIEHASILEQLCKTARVSTPLPHFSTTYKLRKNQDTHKSVPKGLLEHMDLKNTWLFNDNGDASDSFMNDDVIRAAQVRSYSDGLQYGWSVGEHFTSPVWERATSSSCFSERQGSLNSELTCFPIVEDPTISEETENMCEVSDIQEGIGSIAMKNSKKRVLAEITEDYQNLPPSVSAAEKLHNRASLDSVNTEVNFTGTQNKYRPKLENFHSSKKRRTDEAKENQSISLGANRVKKASESLQNRSSKPKLSDKSSLRKGGPSSSQKEPKRNNIVSNITSFVPLVQQKQAAAAAANTGKKDVKIKALEAAKAAKRLEEKRENERKMKKDALKHERARLEQEERARLEQEKKGKRMRMDEEQKQKREQEDKRAEKRLKDTRSRATDERANKRKESQKNMEKQRGGGGNNVRKKPEIEPRTPRVSTSDVSKASMVFKDSEALSDCSIEKVMCNLDEATEEDGVVMKTRREQSYEISPYQVTDDEDEEEDENNNKFVPSWASRENLALGVSSQQKLNPDLIFPSQSMCSIAEVLLPRRLQLRPMPI